MNGVARVGLERGAAEESATRSSFSTVGACRHCSIDARGANARVRASICDEPQTHARRCQEALHRRRSARLPPHPDARQNLDHADQADGDAARPVAGLFAGRRRAGAGDRRGSGQGLRLHLQGQSGRRDLQRHRHPRSRQSRRDGVQAGDGRQERPVQALRRCRFDRHRGDDAGRRGIHHHRAQHRPDLRRHQSRGHQGARMLRHRKPAARRTRHPGLP